MLKLFNIELLLADADLERTTGFINLYMKYMITLGFKSILNKTNGLIGNEDN